MIESVSRKLGVIDIDLEGEKFTVSQVSTDKMDFSEGEKMIQAHEMELSQVKVKKEALNKYVEDQGWLKDLKGIEEKIKVHEEVIAVFKEALKPRNDALLEKAKKLVVKAKLASHYERADKDKKKEVRARTIADIEQKLGLTSQGLEHPVISELRKIFEEVKV